MTATLPDEVTRVFDRFVTTEYTAVDSQGMPITWQVTPYHAPAAGTIDVTTGLGYPKKANDARANPRVALLFSDPSGSEIDGAPMVLVQGTASVDDRDLRANRERYARESGEKLPATKDMLPPKAVQRVAGWYFTRIYVRVRPERVLVWPGGHAGTEPQLLDAHMEEVRSHHDELPEHEATPVRGGEPAWDERIEQLGATYPTAVLTLVAPDGFPFSVRLPVRADAAERLVHIEGDAIGAPLRAGPACIAAHAHGPRFEWQRNFQVRGNLVHEQGGWAVVPHKMVGGFELPPGSTLSRLRLNARKVMRYRKIAKRELAAIAARNA